MPIMPSGPFPNLQEIMDLARSFVNDMYPGTGGTNGRILTNAAPFTIPYVNSAIRSLLRKLRNEGCTFPIKDNVILLNLPVINPPNTMFQLEIGYDGTFDGQQMHATPALPPDLIQPLLVKGALSGTQFSYLPIPGAEEGLPNGLQGPNMGPWDWREYKLCLPGSTQLWNIMLRYQSGQPSINPPPTQFATTFIRIVDCQDALAAAIAIEFGDARGADTTRMQTKYDGFVDDMANEWVRQSQHVNRRRLPYGGSQGGPLGSQTSGFGGIS